MPRPPDRVFQELIAENVLALEDLLGRDIVGEFVAGFTYERFIESSLSFSDRLEMLFDRMRQLPDPSPEVQARVLPPLMRMLRGALKERADCAAQFRWHPTFDVTVALLQVSCSKLGHERVRSVAAPLLKLAAHDVVLPARLSAIGSRPGPERPFEEWARCMKEELRNLAEAWYRPALETLLRLAHEERATSLPKPNTLGGAMAECRKVWPEAVSEQLLMREVWIVRNAGGHKGVTYDLRNETMTFENTGPKGKVERCGPWNVEEIGAFAQRFTNQLQAISSAFYFTLEHPLIEPLLRQVEQVERST